nr:DNA invertase Pin-like site-specific DNA recombinase [Mucilaginibacter sp. X4EP1]
MFDNKNEFGLPHFGLFMDKEKINYFIYARKSTEGEDRQSLSIASQVEDDLKIQARERLTVVDTITDSASAKIPFNRPNYSAMLKRIKQGEASGIIVWKIDRLARNHLEWGELMHLLQTGVIKSIWSTQREYQTKDSALLISLEASMATQFSVDLSAIVKRGLEKKVAMGQPPLIARTGYLNTKLSERGSNTIVPDPVRWELMRKAFDLMLTRKYTMIEITSILNNEHNFRTRATNKRPGSPLAISVLHRAFTDPFYTAHFYYKGKLHKGTYKPMITLEEFDSIQEILGRKTKAKPHSHHFAFTGLMTCGCCGCAITASKKLKKIKATGEYKLYSFYHCTKRKGSAVCADKRYTTEKEMEGLIQQELERLSLIPKWKKWAVDTIKLDYDDELIHQQKILQDLGKEEQKILSELDNLLDLRITNELNEEKYNQKKAERELKLFQVQEKYRRLEKDVSGWIRQIEEIFDFAENIGERFKNGDWRLQKSICQYVGWNWTLKSKKLTFSRHEWFYDIEQLRNHYEQEKERLELIETFEEYRQTASFDLVRSIGCGLREHIRADTMNKIKNSK